MYYGNDYNNYRPIKKPEKNKSYIPLITVIFILIIFAAVAIFAVIYAQSSGRYETDIADLKDQLSELSDYVDKLKKSSDSEVLNNSYNPADSINPGAAVNINGINIAETAARVSPSVIGIKVDVPAQNITSYWRTQPIAATGSGIILTEDGYIVTNYHVVSYAVQYGDAVMTVLLTDDSEYFPVYIGGDEINDLAIIKIDAKNLPCATLGSSDESKVGDFVIAIGNPLGIYLSGSVTFGIISGVNRKIEAENVAEKLIQTDAAINPGNSGGALLNLNGEVIGINTVKISKSNVEGIGFAIPIDYAKPVIESIIKYGYVKDRPTLGVSGMDISTATAWIYDVPRGLYVEEVERGSGAENAGIAANDIITHVDGQVIYGLNDISKLIKKHKVGDEVTVTIWRGGKYYDLSVALTEQK